MVFSLPGFKADLGVLEVELELEFELFPGSVEDGPKETDLFVIGVDVGKAEVLTSLMTRCA